MTGRINLDHIPKAPAPVPTAPVEPVAPRTGPPPGRVRLPPRPVPPPRPEPPPLVLPERRPNPVRDAYLERERREREARLQAIASRRAAQGLAPLGICASVTTSRVQHVGDPDPTVAMLLAVFPDSQVVSVKELA